MLVQLKPSRIPDEAFATNDVPNAVTLACDALQSLAITTGPEFAMVFWPFVFALVTKEFTLGHATALGGVP
jgi:hypothetical protein